TIHLAHSMSLERDQRVAPYAAGFQFAEPAEVRQVDHKSGADHLAAGTADELGSRIGGAAGGDQVVDDENELSLTDRILVDLDGVDAVFERVLLPDGFPGQLALLADGDEAAAEPVRDGAAQNEAARLYAGDRVDILPLERSGQRDNRLLEAIGIAQQGRDVPEYDARLRIVRNRPDQLLQVVHDYLLDALMAAQSA